MKKLIKNLKQRWKDETPIFWKKARNLSIKLGTSSIALITLNNTMNLNIPEIAITIAGYIIVACVTLGFSSQITSNENK